LRVEVDLLKLPKMIVQTILDQLPGSRKNRVQVSGVKGQRAP
jgi:hypothetical protein